MPWPRYSGTAPLEARAVCCLVLATITDAKKPRRLFSAHEATISVRFAGFGASVCRFEPLHMLRHRVGPETTQRDLCGERCLERMAPDDFRSPQRRAGGAVMDFPIGHLNRPPTTTREGGSIARSVRASRSPHPPCKQVEITFHALMRRTTGKAVASAATSRNRSFELGPSICRPHFYEDKES